ncbi:MAG: ABC transporter permease [Gemmatimonadaceae bacterium]
MVARDAVRFAITTGGVGMAVVLMFFLLALYRGVRIESNGWVSSRPAAVWIAQVNTTNFIKASSFLPAAVADAAREQPGVAEAMPLLRLITLLETGQRHLTAIVVGIDSASTLGQPEVVEGTSQLSPGDIILDGALSRRLGAKPGDTLRIEGRPFRVTGISRGTNSVLTQFAFITFEDASSLLGFPGVASYVLVRALPGTNADTLATTLRASIPKVAVLTQLDFADNNMDELRGGLLPILATVAVLGGIVAVAVLTLLLYGSVLERREDYALLKAIGAPSRVLATVMMGQAFAVVSGGVIVGLGVYAIAVPVAARLAPAVPLALSAGTVIVVSACAFVTGVIGTLLPLGRIARIHPAEVFRA